MKKILILFFCISFGCASQPADETAFYVSPSGNDSWSGQLAAPNSSMTDGPFATLERARDTLRDIKKTEGLPDGGLTVWLRGGSYFRDITFELNEQDSGTENAPIIYRSYYNEVVRLVGGREIEPSAFTMVTEASILKRIDSAAQGNVYQADLKKQGLIDFGTLKTRGSTQPVLPAALELFFNDQSMQLARWPNNDYATYGEVIEAGSALRYGDDSNIPGRISYTGDRPERWADSDDVWLAGNWRWLWADQILKVDSIDTEKKEIAFAMPSFYGMRSNNPYYALNILEELDRPGEYYLDHKAGILYFWPPSPIEQGRTVVSIMEEPMIAMEGASYVTIQGMILEATRGMGVYIAGGAYSKVAGCTLRNMGTVAVCIGEGEDGRTIGSIGWNVVNSRLYNDTAWNRNGGTDNGIIGCDIYNTGAQGIILGGGDRKTLTPAGNYVLNNDVHHNGRWYRINHPAIRVDGVGNIIKNNEIHHAEHAGIFYWGNDHLFEFNEFHHLVYACDDAGAIYSGRDASERGIIIRHNFFHHIGESKVSFAEHHLGVWSVMLDDGLSGQRIEGNVFYRGGVGGTHRPPQTIQITGGYDNIIENNIFVDCPPISIAKAKTDEEWMEYVNTPLQQKRLLEAVDVTKPPYINRYPELAGIFDESPEKPRKNYLINNYETTIGDPCFVDGSNLDFTLKKDAKVFTEIPGFKDIPFGGIGLYIDEYRTSLPKDE